MSSSVVVYTGPTVSADEVRAVLPQAHVRPPAARGDLLAERWRPGDVAVVIDGFFRERRSVGHKEILRLIDGGVDVIGAASMGALRAAELAPYGMRGVGEVYGMYAGGEIDGDDEVGVLHGPAAMGYPAQTVALVNLRYACRAAGLSPRIVEAAKSLPFTSRTWAEIGALLDDADRAELPALERAIVAGDADLKRRDALAALEAAGTTGAERSAADAVVFTGLSDHEALTRRSRHEYAPGRWMSDLDVLDAARLFDPEYPLRHERVLSGLLDDLARDQDVDAAAYARTRLGVATDATLPDALAAWLTAGERAGRTPAAQVRLVMVRVWPVWQSVDWRAAVVADLRQSESWQRFTELVADADEAAEQARYRTAVPPPALCARMFQRHWPKQGTSPEIEMGRRGFAGPEELGATVRRFFAYDVQRGRTPAGAAR
ncbi:TfuA-like protein [Krasilnikovia sp. MM14-A1259]|uniref:TfuA-like protein n=1 Tax=Krasilnikovia sp. MM14-A1259 TaxID=3373539 RepID=UPI00380DE2FA